MKRVRLPQIDSIEELAQFWETHDLTDFEEELEEVKVSVFERQPETIIPLHLQPQEFEAVKRAAQARGVAEATLVREWVREKLYDRA